MPSIRLELAQTDPGHIFRFLRPGGVADRIVGLRLKVYVNLTPLIRPGPQATHAAYPACLIDTGAYLTIIPERVWAQFRPGAVSILPFEPTMAVKFRVLSVSGGTFDYDLAEIPMRLQDRVGGVLDISVVAQLTHDAGALTIPVVLGLRGGVIDGRTLRGEPDAIAPYGQLWTLESP